MKTRTLTDFSIGETRLENKLAISLFSAGSFLSDAARPYAPVDTGALRASIDARSVRFLGKLHASVRVSPGVHYDIYQELGTYKMKAHPYLAPSTRDNHAKLVMMIAIGILKHDG